VISNLEERRLHRTPYRRARIYVPMIILNMIASSSKKITLTYFGKDHMCNKHQRLFSLYNIETSDVFKGYSYFRDYPIELKYSYILDSNYEDRKIGIIAYEKLAKQIHNQTTKA